MLPTLRSEDDKRPRFEFYPTNSQTLRTVYIEQTPFTIGRGEENDLQINSTSVSRVHAELSRTSGGYQLRDLGSTNGTTVNGRPLGETLLQDGDAVAVADIELTFSCSSLGRLQRMVTQPLAAPQPAPRSALGQNTASLERELNEAALWLSIPTRLQPIIDLQFGSPAAHIASIEEPLAAKLRAAHAGRNCSAGDRVQDLAWRQVASQVDAIAELNGALLRVELPSRLDHEAFLSYQQAQAGCGKQLGVHLPWEWAANGASGQSVCSLWKRQGAMISLEGFSGAAQCVEDLADAEPDFLVLAPEVVRDVATQRRRWQRLEIVQASCEATGIRAVLPADVSGQDRVCCHQLGIGLAVGSAASPQEAAPPALLATH